MSNKQLLSYVQKSIEKGDTNEQIISALLQQGWSKDDINKAIAKTKKNVDQEKDVLAVPQAPEKSEWNINFKELSVSQVLLYLGGLIVVFAGIIYVSLNWSQWSSVLRIFAIFLPVLLCYVAGSLMFFKDEYKKEGVVFLFVGSLLFPLFLIITFVELEVFAKLFSDSLGLTVSLLSFVLYFILSFIFRFPIWSFLYQAVGLFGYYYLLKLIGVESVTMPWLLLVPGTAYILLSLLYEKKKKKDESRFSNVLGVLVLIFSFFMLNYGELNRWQLVFLIFLGIAYFLLGTFFEKRKLQKHCRSIYFVGAGVFLVFSLRLAAEGAFDNDYHYDQEIIGWSNIAVGVIYLLVGWGIEKLKKWQLKEAVKYSNLFNLIGPLLVLGTIFILGCNGKKPVYETLLLLSSLGFIFGSIPRRTQRYLLIGTSFLIVYIFSIGQEYFQDRVGWSLVLFVAGLTSMGISVAMEKIRRKYFIKSEV